MLAEMTEKSDNKSRLQYAQLQKLHETDINSKTIPISHLLLLTGAKDQ